MTDAYQITRRGAVLGAISVSVNVNWRALALEAGGGCASGPATKSPLAGRGTINSSTNDNGYLANARNHNPSAGRHGSAEEAART